MSTTVASVSPISKRWEPKWIVLIVAVVLSFVFLAFFANKFDRTSMKVDLQGRSIAIETQNLKVDKSAVQRLNPEKYFISSELGYLVERPTGQEWSQPMLFSGLDEYNKMKGVTASEGSDLGQIPSSNPFASLAKFRGVRFVHGQPRSVKWTDSTSTPVLDTLVARASASGEIEDAATARQSVFQELPFSGFDLANECIVDVFDKSQMASLPMKMTLPVFFTMFISYAGFAVDVIEAKEGSLLAGMYVRVTNVLIDNQVADANLYRWALFTESQKHFYVVEIAYSESSGGTQMIWEKLRATMDSFRVIED